MSVKQQPRKWAAEDSKEFDTEAEAEAHNELYVARQAFLDAQKAYGRLLAERQKTADGFKFEWSMLRDYYFIREWHHQLPSMGQVSFYVHDTDVSERDDCLELIYHGGDPGNRDRHHYRIDQLYAREVNAKKALLVAQERFIEECRVDAERLRQELGK
jgi:hypothetical protein